MAGRAGLLHTEEALLHTYRTRAVAGMAGFGMSAGLRAGTVAYIAGFPTGDPDLGIEAVGRLFQADVQRIFKIGAAIDLRTAAATDTPPGQSFSTDMSAGIGATLPPTRQDRRT